MTKYWMITGLLAAAAAGVVHGQLVFEKPLLELQAGMNQDKVVVEFPFTVAGDEEVEIAEYDAPCSCLTARISDNGRLKWRPGEKGVVQGIFELGNIREPVITKLIVLRMKGETEPSVKLTTRLHIPQQLTVEPKTLFWTQGAAPEPQRFQLTVNGDEPLRIVDLSGTNPNFPFELETIEEGRRYEIVVTPQSLESRGFGVLRIKTDSKYPRHERYQGFMAIRKGG